MKAKIIGAPTGWGKGNLLLQIAKETPVIAAVPTLKLAKEIVERAEKKGLKAVAVEGRRNYPCGYKVAEKFGLEEKEEVADVCRRLYEEGCPLELRQGYLCCKRKSCLYDMFAEKLKQAEDCDVVVVSHSFLKLNAFSAILPSGRTLVIDEVHSFVRNLKTPAFPYNVVGVREIKALLKEAKPFLSKKARKQMLPLMKMVENADFSFTGARLLWIKTERGLIEKDAALNKEVMAFCKNLHRALDSFLSSLSSAEKAVCDFLFPVKQTAQILMSPLVSFLSPGSYAVLKGGDNPEIQIRQMLFSSGMWQLWNGILNNLNPKELYLMSATIPNSLTKMLNTKKIECVERKTYYHRFDSILDVVIGSESYSYETREEFLDYFVSFFKKFKRKEKGAVILASSYRDIEYVAERLRGDFSLACQTEDTSADDALKEYEAERADVLIGNRTFWEGLNIQRDSDFFILKVPYSAPDDPDYEAGAIYYERNFFPVHKEDVKTLLIQGLGRIIRKDGEKKRVFIADRRILSFECLFAEVPCYKRYLVL
jgi:Rad3-related DNA helicase